MKKKGECVCPICEEPAIDKSSRKGGQNSVFCEGHCQAWVHKNSASLSNVAFQAVSQSKAPFYCPHCHLDHQGKESATLKATASSLVSELENISKMLGKTSIRKVLKWKWSNVEMLPYLPKRRTQWFSQEMTKGLLHVGASSSSSVVSLNERKFNVVVHGVPECPKGTHQSARASHDLSTVSSFLSKVESSIYSDIYCLGKYSETSQRPRRVLFKFSRLLDATIILSKRSSIKGSTVLSNPTCHLFWERNRVYISYSDSNGHWLIQSGIDRHAEYQDQRLQALVQSRLHGSGVARVEKLYGYC